MKEIEAKILVDAGCELAEGPIYDEKGGLYWLDIELNRIYYYDLSAERTLYMQLDRPIGSIVLSKSGTILAGMDDGVYEIDGLRYDPHCIMKEADAENIRFNDGKCDPVGRFIVGTQVNPNNAEMGCLFSTDEKGSYRVLSEGLGCSNGLAWTQDGKTMYHVDTLVEHPSRIYAFDYDKKTGVAANRREVIDFSPLAEKGILADGMTIDRDGNLWIAEWGGYGIGCWNPKTGKKIAHVSVPTARASCCTFGGENYDTLYITTAKNDDGSGVGGVYYAKLDVSGFPAIKYSK